MKFTMLIAIAFLSCSSSVKNQTTKADTKQEIRLDQDLSVAYFASGCFWCVEAVFESVIGVKEAVSGYAGGTKKNANYRSVSNGITKHAESVAVYYDPNEVSYETLLKVFFGSHDPTTLNRQGPDRGTQYRSAIFFGNEAEKLSANKYIETLYQEGTFPKNSITTELAMIDVFYPAEDYHQDYEKKNPNQSYVRAVSIPRLNRFKAKFPELLKEEAKH